MRDEEFEGLFAEHAPLLFAFLVYRTGNRPLSEDLMSETFERALRARRRFDPRRSSQKTWLYTIALNLLRDRARREAAEQRALERMGPPPAGSAEAGFEAVEARDELGRELERLSAEEREAVALRFGADLTMPEVAKATGESVSTIEGRVYRALRKLREGLEH